MRSNSTCTALRGVAAAPVVVWLHGGALIAFSRDAILQRQGILEACLAAGLAVAAIDYRLAPETKLPETSKTCVTPSPGSSGMGGTHGLDAERVGVVGLSAGAVTSRRCRRSWSRRARA